MVELVHTGSSRRPDSPHEQARRGPRMTIWFTTRASSPGTSNRLVLRWHTLKRGSLCFSQRVFLAVKPPRAGVLHVRGGRASGTARVLSQGPRSPHEQAPQE